MSSLGMGLAVVSSLLLLALVAELYYIFWWKKRYNSKLSMLFCFKTPTPIQMIPRSRAGGGGDSESASVAVTVRSQFHHDGGEPLRGGGGGGAAAAGEEAIDAELMRLHSLAGPPRFLFTIKEETREELLESDDGRRRSRSRKGSRGRSLGDLLHCVDSPFLTPLSSPPLPFLQSKSNNRVNFDSLKKLGFNPLLESTTFRSPPPKLKFLKEAEEKLHRKIMTSSLSSISIQTEKY